MKMLMKRHKTDKEMIEVFFKVAGQGRLLLACVMHEDCIEGVEINEALDEMPDGVDVALTIVDE